VRSAEPLNARLSDRAPDWTVHVGAPLAVDGPPVGTLIGDATYGPFQYWCARVDEPRWVVRHRHSAETTFDRDARTIVVRPDPRADDGYAALLLAGSGMAHALAIDGHSALHASAVEVDGRAIAFIGPSGQGKTTLAALLCGEGARAVTDDVLRCEIGGDEAACYRGSSSLRLRSQAASLAGDGARAASTADGRTAATFAPTPHSLLPLGAIVVPAPDRTAGALSVRRLRGREAATELLRSPRLAGLFDRELVARHLDLSRGLAATVPVLEARIPWGPPFPDRLAERLIDGLASAT
jgi:hypothetical protein